MERGVARGDIWIVAGGAEFTGKPRPALVVQHYGVLEIDTLTVCPFSSSSPDADLIRLAFQPTPQNGLRTPCHLMIDKISTLPRTKLGQRIGAASSADMARVNDALMIFLGLAG